MTSIPLTSTAPLFTRSDVGTVLSLASNNDAGIDYSSGLKLETKTHAFVECIRHHWTRNNPTGECFTVNVGDMYTGSTTITLRILNSVRCTSTSRGQTLVIVHLYECAQSPEAIGAIGHVEELAMCARELNIVLVVEYMDTERNAVVRECVHVFLIPFVMQLDILNATASKSIVTVMQLVKSAHIHTRVESSPKNRPSFISGTVHIPSSELVKMFRVNSNESQLSYATPEQLETHPALASSSEITSTLTRSHGTLRLPLHLCTIAARYAMCPWDSILTTPMDPSRLESHSHNEMIGTRRLASETYTGTGTYGETEYNVERHWKSCPANARRDSITIAVWESGSQSMYSLTLTRQCKEAGEVTFGILGDSFNERVLSQCAAFPLAQMYVMQRLVMEAKECMTFLNTSDALADAGVDSDADVKLWYPHSVVCERTSPGYRADGV